jgi:IMP cyclohydrolase
MSEINFKIFDQYGEYVGFRVKTSTPMRRIIDAYKERQAISQNINLVIDSTEITIFDTPRSLAMNENDFVYAFIITKDCIDIKVMHQNKTGFMRVYHETTILTLINIFANKYDIDLFYPMILKFGTHVCKDGETMKDLGIKTGDTLHDSN